MKNLSELKSMTKYLQDQIDLKNISEVQKMACKRAVWYTVVGNYSLANADIRARRAYNIARGRISTKKYILEVFNEHCGIDYFKNKEKVRTAKFFKEIRQF